MKKFISRIRESIVGTHNDEDIIELEDEYVELDSTSHKRNTGDAKIVVRPFVLNDFSDIKDILASLRNGYTIAMVNIRPLKEKDIIELKRAINKLKKTCDAIKGDIAGVGDDFIIVAPSFAEIYRTKGQTTPAEAAADD